jgi:hypothetical protein
MPIFLRKIATGRPILRQKDRELRRARHLL